MKHLLLSEKVILTKMSISELQSRVNERFRQVWNSYSQMHEINIPACTFKIAGLHLSMPTHNRFDAILHSSCEQRANGVAVIRVTAYSSPHTCNLAYIDVAVIITAPTT